MPADTDRGGGPPVSSPRRADRSAPSWEPPVEIEPQAARPASAEIARVQHPGYMVLLRLLEGGASVEDEAVHGVLLAPGALPPQLRGSRT